MEIKNIAFTHFNEVTEGNEGLVFLGTGGNLQEWVDGVYGALVEEKLISSGPIEDTFSDVYLLETSGGRHDLAFVFKENAQIEIGKLALWRIELGDCSWISDYIVNYASQHST